MLGWFQALMPKEEKFFDLFERHARTLVAGSRALRSVLDGGPDIAANCARVSTHENEADALEWSKTATVGFSKPVTREEELPFENHPAPHAALMENFVAAVLDGTPLIAPGADGMHSVELANAIVFSSIQGKTLALPMDGAAWERELQTRIRDSRFEKVVREVSADDFAQSFRR